MSPLRVVPRRLPIQRRSSDHGFFTAAGVAKNSGTTEAVRTDASSPVNRTKLGQRSRCKNAWHGSTHSRARRGRAAAVLLLPPAPGPVEASLPKQHAVLRFLGVLNVYMVPGPAETGLATRQPGSTEIQSPDRVKRTGRKKQLIRTLRLREVASPDPSRALRGQVEPHHSLS